MVGIWVPGGKVPLCRGIYHYDCSFWCRLLQVHKTSTDSVYYQKLFLSENDHVLASSLAFQVRKTCLNNRRNQKQHLKVGKVHVVYQSLVDEESPGTTHNNSRATSTDPVQKETCHAKKTPTSSNSRPANPITSTNFRTQSPSTTTSPPWSSPLIGRAGPALSLDKTGRVPHSMIGPSSRSGRDPVRFPWFWKVKFLKWVRMS